MRIRQRSSYGMKPQAENFLSYVYYSRFDLASGHQKFILYMSYFMLTIYSMTLTVWLLGLKAFLQHISLKRHDCTVVEIIKKHRNGYWRCSFLIIVIVLLNFQISCEFKLRLSLLLCECKETMNFSSLFFLS